MCVYVCVYIFSFQERKWILLESKPNVAVSLLVDFNPIIEAIASYGTVYSNAAWLSNQVPRPRSGAQMIIHGPDDSLYIYGGYSKEKMAGLANAGTSSQKNEGKVHEDMWFINLKQVITADAISKIGGAGAVNHTMLSCFELLIIALY